MNEFMVACNWIEFGSLMRHHKGMSLASSSSRTLAILIIALIGCVVLGLSTKRHDPSTADHVLSSTLGHALTVDEPPPGGANMKQRRAFGPTLHRLASVELRNLSPKLMELVRMVEKQSGFLENPLGYTDAYMAKARKDFWSKILDLNEEEVRQLVLFYESKAADEFIGDETVGPLLYYRLGQLDGPRAVSDLEAKLNSLLEADSNEELDLDDPLGIACGFTSSAPSCYSGWASVDRDAASAHWNDFLLTQIGGNPRILRFAEFSKGVARYLQRGASNEPAACPYLLWE